LIAYKRLCNAINESGNQIYTVRSFFENNPKDSFLILRHDVDSSPRKALAMAKIEHSLGIRSTYYFRYVFEGFDEKIIKIIASLGHEIGYHYETLYKCEGDFKKAIRLFEKELKEFRKSGVEIKTVCAHGSGPKFGLNCDIFEFQPGLSKETDLLGEAYIDIDFGSLKYYSDSGKNWYCYENVPDLIHKVFKFSKESFGKKASINDLIKEISHSTDKRFYILIHPQWWSENITELFKKWFLNDVAIPVRRTVFK